MLTHTRTQAGREPHACFLAQNMPLQESIAACTAFRGALVRTTSGRPLASGGGGEGGGGEGGGGGGVMDTAWGALLEFALKLTGAAEGFYWPGYVSVL